MPPSRFGSPTLHCSKPFKARNDRHLISSPSKYPKGAATYNNKRMLNTGRQETAQVPRPASSPQKPLKERVLEPPPPGFTCSSTQHSQLRQLIGCRQWLRPGFSLASFVSVDRSFVQCFPLFGQIAVILDGAPAIGVCGVPPRAPGQDAACVGRLGISLKNVAKRGGRGGQPR